MNDKREERGFEMYQNGNTYQGEYQNGKPNGKGVFSWMNGEVYQGQWENGKKKGHGVWKGIEGDSYIGSWVDNKADGYGIHTWVDGDRYEGEWKACLRQGKGTDFFSNGDVYVGVYADGKPCGKGQYKWFNGDTYIGEFKESMKHGQGKWKQLPTNPAEPNKFNSFEGKYENDVKHGWGCFEWEAGNKYTGNYRFDERDGWGTMEWIDGSQYSGHWKKGIQQGLGIMNFEIGEKKTKKQRAGFFENNIFIKPLTSRDEMRDFEQDMPAEYKEKLLEYLASRDHKLRKRNRNETSFVEGSEAAYESANEAIGVEFKKPILNATPMGVPETFDGIKEIDDQNVYDVKEEKMREIQGMVEVGKTVNPN